MSVPVNYKHYEIKDHSIRLSHHSIFSTWYSMPDYSKHLLNTCGMKCIANLKKKKAPTKSGKNTKTNKQANINSRALESIIENKHWNS